MPKIYSKEEKKADYSKVKSGSQYPYAGEGREENHCG